MQTIASFRLDLAITHQQYAAESSKKARQFHEILTSNPESLPYTKLAAIEEQQESARLYKEARYYHFYQDSLYSQSH